jgi:hypothetical protein
MQVDPMKPKLTSSPGSKRLKVKIDTSHIHGGDLLPFRDLSLFLSQFVLDS